MFALSLVLSFAALLLSVLSLSRTFTRRVRLTLMDVVAVGVDAATRCAIPPKDRARFATDVAAKLDMDADGKRDWSDAQIRLTVEAELSRRGL